MLLQVTFMLPSGLWGSELKPRILAQQAGTLSTKPSPQLHVLYF